MMADAVPIPKGAGGLAARLDHAPLADLAQRYLSLLLAGNRQQASREVLAAVEQGTDVRDVYLHVFQPVLYEVGRLWQTNQVSVATEHYCTAATQFIMSQLFPQVLASERTGRTMVAACVGGELHELGMRMVADFFEMEGWDTYFLGASTPERDVADAVARRKAELLCVSVTMTQNVHLAARLILAVRTLREAAGAKVMVGGFPFRRNPRLYRFVGADACADNARQALEVARALFHGGRDAA